MKAEPILFAVGALLGAVVAGAVVVRNVDAILIWAEARHRAGLRRYAARHPARPGAVTTRRAGG